MTSNRKESPKSKQKSYADAVTNVPSVLVGKLAKYNRLNMIASGTFGKCYEVVNQATDKRFACKILSSELVRNKSNVQMVRNEIKLHGQLRHPHVVVFVESFSDTDHIYIVQKLCVHGSLRELQSQRKRFDASECRYVVHQIFSGLEYIHENGILHRDLKLSNIFIDKHMQMRIGDFGLAILEKDAIEEANFLMGTTSFMAPEVIDLKGFNRRSDVWAVGVIAFVLLYGRKPFEAVNEATIHKRICDTDYRLPAGVDAELKTFFRSIFTKNFEDRSDTTGCLRLGFFRNHNIPPTLQIQTLPKVLAMDVSKQSTRVANDMIEYPPVCVQTEHTNFDSIDHNVMRTVFHHFDTICRARPINNDASINNFTHLSDRALDYWITMWSYDSETGFAYQLSDGSIGVLFFDGVHFLRTANKSYWSVTSDGVLQWIGIPRGKTGEYLNKFDDFEKRLLRNGSVGAETASDHGKLPHLVGWLQTDKAMVMCLSNHTVQINFTTSHRKVVICPHNETITFVTDRICRANFKTVTFDMISAHGFSSQDFSMLKYITGMLKHLMAKGEEANK